MRSNYVHSFYLPEHQPMPSSYTSHYQSCSPPHGYQSNVCNRGRNKENDLLSCQVCLSSIVNSKLDYCNSLAYGLPKYLLQKLQYVQNAAARLITGIRKHDHITPILMDLHWLPVNQRIQFKILLLTFKSLNGLAPVYIDEMIQRYVPNRKLRSSSAFLLKQNKWNLKSYGFRTFTVAAPFLWNSLPLEVKSSPSLNIFKSKLKTHLFKCAFNLN